MMGGLAEGKIFEVFEKLFIDNLKRCMRYELNITLPLNRYTLEGSEKRYNSF